MKILFVGDVVGSLGREMLRNYLPALKRKYQPQFTIVNGENAAGGRGITQKIYQQFLEWGADVVTLGNHSWDNKEIFDFIEGAHRLIRPANFPPGTPGKGHVIVKNGSEELAVINAQGRTFLPALDCPFRCLDELVAQIQKRTKYIFVDFHAEATSEKQAIGWFLDGRVSAVIGTHTHVQTADERILPQGTAYLTDAGMCGARDSILGMEKQSVLKRFLTALPVRFEVETNGAAQLNAVLVELKKETGFARSIQRILIDDDHPFVE